MVALLIGAFPLAVEGQSAPAIDPATALRIDSVFRSFARPGSPGCALGVMQEGRLSYAKGYGLASVELSVPITPATGFDIGSVSKQFTALAVVLLAQEGKLRLDDEIQKYLPEIPRYARPVTIRHLLHHTSGLRDYIDLLSWSGAQDESVTGEREALEILSRQKGANFEAGAEYRYSNSGFFLLSVIVKRASGQSLRQFAAERIFGPLAMTHSFFLDDHLELVPGKATSYSLRASQRPEQGVRLNLANWEQVGDGAVQTTIEDLLLWVGNFTTGRVGGMEAIRELETTGVLNDGKPIDYALGQSVDRYRGVRRVAHGGAWMGFRAQLTRYPEQGLALSVLCNLANTAPGNLADRVADILLSDKFTSPVPGFTRAPPRAPINLPVRPLGDYAGRYHSDELLADWLLYLRGDSLRVRIGPLVDEPVRFSNEGIVAGGTVLNFLEAGGKVSGITLTSRGARDFRLTRIAP